MTTLQRYDIVIIGGGPTGLACAIEARKHNLKYIVLEKGLLVNSIFHFPANMTFFSTSQKLEIGDVPFISHVDKPTRREALEYYRRIYESWGLKVNLYEKVNGMVQQSDGTYEVVTAKNRYSAKAVVVATGFYDTPRMMGVPGEDLSKVKHFYDEAHHYVGQKVLVIGAANSACDVALETYYKGAEVTMAIREDKIYEKVKYWIRPNIENRIAEGSIKAYFNTSVKEIKPKEVTLSTPKGDVTLANDFVLAMTGYMPDYSFLQNIGINILDDALQHPQMDPDTFETNLPNVYLAGVIQAGLHTSKLFIENTRHHGEVIVSQILERMELVRQ